MATTTSPESSSENAFVLTWRLLLLMVAAWLMVLALLALRMRVMGQTGHLSLVWDLTLAWIPVGLAILAAVLAGRGKSIWLILPIGGLWLAFLPNSPYLLTELIHLAPGHLSYPKPLPNWVPDWLRPVRRVSGSPAWIDLILLLSVALCGLLLTLVSLRIARSVLQTWLRKRTAIVLTLLLLPVISFGVALGRFQRLNTWDIVVHPGRVIERIGLAAHDTPVLVSTAALTFILTLADASVGVMAGSSQTAIRRR